MSHFSDWEADWVTVITEEHQGWRLAVLENDIKPIAQIIDTNPDDEIQNQIDIRDPREVRGVIEALEKILEEMDE